MLETIEIIASCETSILFISSLAISGGLIQSEAVLFQQYIASIMFLITFMIDCCMFLLEKLLFKANNAGCVRCRKVGARSTSLWKSRYEVNNQPFNYIRNVFS
jgi:hypothetical protein